ncbi:hypothetical protein BDY19DRAFT_914873 [Irpex rosettiformis]|uniref:Uncharacterized protein n=1 Tax=Irpex rosettiformis TaxID=378272 RepID=A0ACB8UKC3_9APHY|nr:hypothetical protein BDY19DRAFT_914873 [Irpex rosettiformis]
MLIDDRDRKRPLSTSDVGIDDHVDLNAAGSSDPSGSPPPAFASLPISDSPNLNANGEPIEFADNNFFVPPGGEGPPPPDFAPYVAEYFEAGDGSVVSHDPHLNEDGEALYRFILSQSHIPPQLLLIVKGHHQEHQTRSVRRIDDRGHARWETETESVTVHDFDFQIDVSQYILREPTQWSIPDEEPAYRGTMNLEVDGVLMPSRMSFSGPSGEDGATEALLWQEHESGRRRRWKASKQERKRANTWKAERKMRGLPPWIGPPSPVGHPVNPEMYRNDVMKSTMTVREWADEYCASDKMLKEFTYQKVIYGWNFSALEAAVVAAVKSTHYNGHLTVEFKRRGDKVFVRADNWISRTLSNKWLVILLCITFVYPFIWLFKRFYQGGGGKWEVCGGAYALKSWKLLDYSSTSALGGNNEFVNADAPPPFPGALDPTVADLSNSLNNKTLVNTQMGVAEVVGLREGEWFQMWEGSIKRAVVGRLKSQVPLTVPDDGPLPAALMLDGYQARPLVTF